MAIILVHIVGLVLAGLAFCIGALRLLRAEDRLVPMLVVGIVVVMAAFVASTESVSTAYLREIAPVLPFSAVLAGRLLPGSLLRTRGAAIAVTPVLLAALLAYAGVLGYSASRPAPAPWDLQSWLMARHLTAGIGDYWTANLITVNTGGQVRERAVITSCGRFAPYAWETKKAWYEPPNTANFLVLDGTSNGTAAQATAQFGPPRQTVTIGTYQVLIWNHNLLPAVTSGFPPGCGGWIP